MTATFTKLARYMKEEKTNQFVAGRTTKHNIPDMIMKGMSIMLTDVISGTLTTDEEGGSAMGIEDDDDLDDL